MIPTSVSVCAVSITSHANCPALNVFIPNAPININAPLLTGLISTVTAAGDKKRLQTLTLIDGARSETRTNVRGQRVQMSGGDRVI